MKYKIQNMSTVNTKIYQPLTYWIKIKIHKYCTKKYCKTYKNNKN